MKRSKALAFVCSPESLNGETKKCTHELDRLMCFDCYEILCQNHVNGHVANEGHVTFRKVSEGEVIVIVKN